MNDNKTIEKFMNMIPKNTKFVFWVCPNNCNGIVEWNKDYTIAACMGCGTTSNEDEWPCQQLLGGTGAAIYMNVDGMCKHPECNPINDDR